MTRSTAPAPPVRVNRVRRSRTAFSSDELEQSIERLQTGVYRVDRTLLERAFARAPRIARATRARTVQGHGSPVGLSLTRIPAGGLFEHLGLKRGDILKTVNGYQIASMDGMLSARTQLASASRLSLALVRGGRPMTLEYRIR
jgi:general secretion pathway protein C